MSSMGEFIQRVLARFESSRHLSDFVLIGITGCWRHLSSKRKAARTTTPKQPQKNRPRCARASCLSKTYCTTASLLHLFCNHQNQANGQSDGDHHTASHL